jgi:GPH family glycoside/pentoside/hexuronide:cation symporter
MQTVQHENTSVPGSPRRFLGYASGNCGIAILRQIIVFLPLYFYSPPGGQGTEYLPARSVGLALFLARLVDVVSDPIIGYLSDRTRHSWGKRLPYIVWGAPVWLLATVLIFAPPVPHNSMANFLYLTVLGSIFFVSTAVVQIPYMAVLPEIAWQEDEAVRVAARMGRFFILGVLLFLGGVWFLADKLGFFGAAVIFSLISCVPFVLAIRELFAVEQRPVEHYRQHFWQSVIAIVRQRPFWTYLVGHSLFICGYYAMLVACPYFATEILRLPKTLTSVFLLAPMITAIAVAPLVERMSLRVGKKSVLLWAMLLYVVLASLWFFVGKGSWVQGAATLADAWGIRAPWAGQVNLVALLEAVALFLAVGIAVSVQMLVPPALVADLVVYDEQHGGQRRESMVYGLQAGIEKNAVMIATLVVSLALEGGKEAGNPAGIYLVGPMGALLTFVGCLVFLLYPLTKGWRDRRN